MLLLKTLAVVAMEAAPAPAPDASPVGTAEPDPRAEPISNENLVYVLVPVSRDGDTVVMLGKSENARWLQMIRTT